MTIKRETVEEVIKLMKQGFTQEQITEKTGVSERTQRHWKKEGYPGFPASPRIQQARDKVSDVKRVNAAELVKAGFVAERVHIILGAQDLAIQRGNPRLSLFLNRYVEIGQKWDTIPPSWRALLAGFPIIGKDIGSNCLIELASLVEELHPYISKELRRTYHKRAKSILMGVLAELQAFLQDAAMAGGLPLVVSGGPPPDWRDLLPWNTSNPRSWKIDESLVQGFWEYMVPSKVVETKIDIKGTWAGFLFDIVSRLPDPDRQKGKLLKNYDLTVLSYIWCSTAPQDFKPPLPDIRRTNVSSGENTFAGIYKRMVEYSRTHEE
ncbi:helix-turn-helix domain-containing protein [Dehalogenimonas alkenigignens]|uniref:helix-turn-helix domain-containing protein n=1 Tax=Dehalogenimonas alkenigignens TaxID=1217799 RepID=UPI000D56941B|nr:helix-turn-helix domain-containing protein [Dehalogenimonas alkenigignens]PVV83290.1 hypothetical protein DD509_06870 [Dehalogenimonas alkenigignens]